MSNKRSQREFQGDEDEHSSKKPRVAAEKVNVWLSGISVPAAAFKGGMYGVPKSMTIRALKTRIASRIAPFTVDDIAMVYDGKQLDNDTALEQLVGDEGNINLEILIVSGFAVTLTTRYGQTLSVGDIAKDCTMRGLKDKMAAEYGIPSKHLIMCSQQSKKALSDDMLVSSSPKQAFDLVIVEDVERALRDSTDLIILMAKPVQYKKIPLVGIGGGETLMLESTSIKTNPLSRRLRITDYRGSIWINADQIESFLIPQDTSLYDQDDDTSDSDDDDVKVADADKLQIVFLKTKAKFDKQLLKRDASMSAEDPLLIWMVLKEVPLRELTAILHHKEHACCVSDRVQEISLSVETLRSSPTSTTMLG